MIKNKKWYMNKAMERGIDENIVPTDGINEKLYKILPQIKDYIYFMCDENGIDKNKLSVIVQKDTETCSIMSIGIFRYKTVTKHTKRCRRHRFMKYVKVKFINSDIALLIPNDDYMFEELHGDRYGDDAAILTASEIIIAHELAHVITDKRYHCKHFHRNYWRTLMRSIRATWDLSNREAIDEMKKIVSGIIRDSKKVYKKEGVKCGISRGSKKIYKKGGIK